MKDILNMLMDFLGTFVSTFIFMTILAVWIFSIFLPVHLASFGSLWNIAWWMLTIPFATGYTVMWFEYTKK